MATRPSIRPVGSTVMRMSWRPTRAETPPANQLSELEEAGGEAKPAFRAASSAEACLGKPLMRNLPSDDVRAEKLFLAMEPDRIDSQNFPPTAPRSFSTQAVQTSASATGRLSRSTTNPENS